MLVRINNLTKTHHRNDGAINAIDNFSLDIPKDSFVTITGGLGSGKTTLLLILGGFLRTTSGSMIYNGKKIYLHSDKELATFRSNHEGFVMQNFV